MDRKSKIRYDKLNNYLNVFKNKSIKILSSSKTKIEIEKCKIELSSEYKKIGRYISKKYLEEDVINFTYDDKYKLHVDKIKKLILYINKLKKNIL